MPLVQSKQRNAFTGFTWLSGTRLTVSLLKAASVLLLIFWLQGCMTSRSFLVHDGAPERTVAVAHIPDAVPKVEPISKGGNRSPYTVLGKTYYVNFNSQGFAQQGYASWYGTKFHGNATANGETYDMYAMSAAHKTLPIPSYVKVTNLENKKTVVVRVNDRGPFHPGRIIDLSYVAAKKLDMLQKGTAKVMIEVISPANGESPSSSTPTSLVKRPSEPFLQVGAFKAKDSAVTLKTYIESQTQLSVRVVSVNSLHRVLVGPIKDSAEEVSLRQQLHLVDVRESHIVHIHDAES